jgi:hypothetical protein
MNRASFQARLHLLMQQPLWDLDLLSCWKRGLVVVRVSERDAFCILRTDLGNFIVAQCVRKGMRGGERREESMTYMTTSIILIGFTGLSFVGFTFTRSIFSSTSSPPTTFPNTVCLLSRCGVARKVIKN